MISLILQMRNTLIFGSGVTLRRLVFALLGLIASPVVAQVSTVQDCLGAVAVCQGYFEQEQAFSGTGNFPNEINPLVSCLLSGERNDVWYLITVQSAGNLSFTITPNNYDPLNPNPNGDDYDWALFNLTLNDCHEIFSNGSLEASCNYDMQRGPTGANGLPGDQNESTLLVADGELYVLNICNFSASQSGYVLDFTASTAGVYDTEKPFMTEVLPIACRDTVMVVRFSEYILCNTIDASDFQFVGPDGVHPVISVSSDHCAGGGHHDRLFAFATDRIFSDGDYVLNLIGAVEDLCLNISLPGVLTFTVSGNNLPPLVATVNSACLGATLQFNATSYETASYQWTGPGGFTSQLQAPVILNVTAAANGTYQLTATLPNGCLLADSVDVVIQGVPTGQKLIFHD